MRPLSVWVGYDPREVDGFVVARHSIRRNTSAPLSVRGLSLQDLVERGLYTRPIRRKGGRMEDVISKAPMSTEFALSRFLVPHLAQTGWALFMDCDMLIRGSLMPLFEQADPSKAVMVVKHDFTPTAKTKMDSQVQTKYERKIWSSVLLFNCDHPANKALYPNFINSARGLHLHQFAWLQDHQIGELDERWNHLVGYSEGADPQIVHFTEGIPSMPGREDSPYANEWRLTLQDWIKYG